MRARSRLPKLIEAISIGWSRPPDAAFSGSRGRVDRLLPSLFHWRAPENRAEGISEIEGKVAR